MKTGVERTRSSSGIRFVFSEGPCSELLETRFSHPLLPRPLVSVRGRTGFSAGQGTFGWSGAVRGLCALFISHRLEAVRNTTRGEGPKVRGIGGGRGSVAAALDSALAKQPAWIQEIFGVDSAGNSILKRMLRRVNPERKRAGPTQIYRNDSAADSFSIQVIVGDAVVEDASQ